MTVYALETPKFLRKTTLGPNERNTNFIMSDRDAVDVVSSGRADEVTPLMSKIYNRLVLANKDGVCQESNGVLHFAGMMREGKRVGAWDQLCGWLAVSSETARKALLWLHEQGVIGYKAYKNGVGIWIFLNRAASSIAVGTQHAGRISGRKNLPLDAASAGNSPASAVEAPFMDTYGIRDDLENIKDPDAQKNSAGENESGFGSVQGLFGSAGEAGVNRVVTSGSLVAEITRRVRTELEPSIRKSARVAAVEAVSREQARTREWFEQKALPKAVRVAQRETYNLMRRSGEAGEKERRAKAELEVGRSNGTPESLPAHPLGLAEIDEVAETCVALYMTQGAGIDATIAGICSDVGGFLLPEDAPRVRESVRKLLPEREGNRSLPSGSAGKSGVAGIAPVVQVAKAPCGVFHVSKL